MTIKVTKKKYKAHEVMGVWERARHPVWRTQGGRGKRAASSKPSGYLGRAIEAGHSEPTKAPRLDWTQQL